MNRNLLLLALCAVMSAACSSSDALADPEGTAELLQDCSLEAFLAVLVTFDQVGDIIDEALGDDQENVTLTPTGTANEFDVTATFDTDGDRVDDVTLTGTALFSVDPAGGLNPGDTVTVALTQTGSVAATYNIAATLGLGTIALTGTANVPNAGGCNATLTFPTATPLVIDDDRVAEMQLAGIEFPNFIDFQVQGVFSIVVIGNGATLRSDVTLDGSNSVNFTNVSINGINLDPGFILLPPGSDVAVAANCLARGILTMEQIADVIGDVAQSLFDGEPLDNGAGFTASTVEGQPNTFDISIATSTETFTGRVTFPSDPNAGPITGLVTIPTWQITQSVVAGFSFSFSFTGNSTATFGLTLSSNDPASYYGTGVFTEDDCTTTVAVAPSAPFDFVANGTNRITFSTTFEDATVGADMLVINESEFFDIVFVNALVNGLPVPGALLDNFSNFLRR